MNKVWYIFYEDHHTGPFSSEEIFRMFYDEIINKDSLMWKEGQENWKALNDIDELYNIITLEDDKKSKADQIIPSFSLVETPNQKPLEMLTEEEADKAEYFDEAKDKEQSKKEATPPPFIPKTKEEKLEDSIQFSAPLEETHEEVVKEIEKNYSEVSEVKKEEEVVVPVEEDKPEDNIPLPPSPSTDTVGEDIKEQAEILEEKIQESILEEESLKEKVGQTLMKYDVSKNKTGQKIITVLAVIALVVVTWLVLPQKYENRVFHGLSKEEHKRLEQTIKSRKGFRAALALSPQNKNIWLATNRSGEAVIYITLKSIKDKILSDDKVVIFSKSKLTNNMAKFERLEVTEGHRFVPGYYQVEIYGHNTGLIPRVKDYIKKTKMFGWMFAHYKKDFYLKKTTLLQGWTPSKFNKILASYNKKQHLLKIRPLIDLKEAYKTLGGLIDRSRKIFKEVLTKSKRPKKFLDAFNRVYATTVSPIYQGIMNENKKIHDNIPDSDTDKKGMYRRFLEIGKESGGIIADVVTKTQKHRKLSKGIKSLLIRELNKKYTKQTKIIKKRIHFLAKEISKLD